MNNLLKHSSVRALQQEMPGTATEDHSEVDRKPSIMTQDFVNQAAQIMAMIRNQVRQPGLSSVEESEAENATPEADEADDSYQESTNEPLSRPPSREGKPMSRMPQYQEDPELIKRLKKYQEISDMGDLITLSMRSMGLVKEAILADQKVERQIEGSQRSQPDVSHNTEEGVISDPPNIRLTAGLMMVHLEARHDLNHRGLILTGHILRLPRMLPRLVGPLCLKVYPISFPIEWVACILTSRTTSGSRRRKPPLVNL
jgi:hypothetical protein